MKDKSKTSIVIGELIKRELKKQGKTSVWLAGELGCHRTNVYKIYDRSTIDSACFSTSANCSRLISSNFILMP